MARPDELTFAPLGGVGEIGMNLSIYGLGNRHQRSWLAIDLGVSFGDEEHLPGIDLIMPDVRFLEKERKNLVGLVLTHAHEDHFGAIIDLWPKLRCPIYATKFSAALFEAKCASERNPPKIPVTVVPSGGTYTEYSGLTFSTGSLTAIAGVLDTVLGAYYSTVAVNGILSAVPAPSFNSGDVLSVLTPATDATLANALFTLKGST